MHQRSVWFGRDFVCLGGRFRGNLRWQHEVSHQYRPNWMQQGVDRGMDLQQTIVLCGGNVHPLHLVVGPVEMHSVVDAVEENICFEDSWSWAHFAKEWLPEPDEEHVSLRKSYEEACVANGITPLPMFDRRPWRERQAELDQNADVIAEALARCTDRAGGAA